MTEDILTPYEHQQLHPVSADCHDRPILAAIDLGSNSFRMLIARWENNTFTEITRSKGIVQIARGIDSSNRIQPEALNRSLQCLHEFRRILNHSQPTHVDVVATQALRQASNANDFLTSAQAALGQTVNIITPQQEAELGFLGVQHFYGNLDDSLMVIDIGGASTELSIGTNQTLNYWHSLQLGCVTLANQFFQPDLYPSIKQSINQAYQYCCKQIEAMKDSFLTQPWNDCLGASGTMRVMADLLGSNQQTISRADLTYLLQYAIDHEGLPETIDENIRRDVLPAGLVLLAALFDSLEIEKLTVSPGSVKQGLMIKRLQTISYV